MRTILRSKVTLLFLTIAVLLAIPAIAAIADTITADPDPATIAVVENNVNKAPGGTGTAKVWLAVDDNTTDPVNGCNANSSNPVAITLSSNDSDVTFDSTGTTANPASLTGCDAVNGKQIGFKVSSSATGPFPKTVTVTATGSGGRTPSGNIPAYTSDTFTITIPPPADATAPDTNILTNPNDPTNSTSANFTYSSTEANSTFECSLDGGSYASCPSSGKSYSSLSAGSHTFSVRATDEAGNTDATPASYTWFVDTVAPDTSISAQPDDPTNSTSASFSFSGTDNHTTTANLDFECSLDGGAYGSCTSPKSYSSLSAGSHTFSVRATDEAGNTDATPASYTWFVDTVAPDTSITAQPDDPTNSTSASCSSPKSYSSLSAGSHTFSVRATDEAGNTDATPASYTWFVDTVAPDTSITAQPDDPTNSTSASFSFSGTDNHTTTANL